MNNQNYQILLGIILLVVYFTCFRKSEGFFGMGGRSLVGREHLFYQKTFPVWRNPPGKIDVMEDSLSGVRPG